MKEIDFDKLRQEMVINQIAKRGITDQKVLEAFRQVPRHLFIPQNQKYLAYDDYPLPIGVGQTISQPYMVALMTAVLDVRENEKVLEIGTGSGYQAAILAYLSAKVYSIERIAALAAQAKELLSSLNYCVQVKVGDGTLGWQENGPYDKIIVTAAAPVISPSWIEQLKETGKMVVPLGGAFGQDLTVIEKIGRDNIKQTSVCSCIFVPLIGKYGQKG
jgi:protein-L-isoaspartate(D-aspartate) O-methyltransferase